MLLKMLAFNCLDNHQQVAKREWQYDIRTEQLVVAWEVEQINAEKYKSIPRWWERLGVWIMATINRVQLKVESS